MLPLKCSGPSRDFELSQRGAPPRPGPWASSPSGVAQTFAAPQQGKVARACERVCSVPCNLRVARDRAAQQNAAVEGAVLIAQQEATDWDHGMAIHASAVADISAAPTAAAARGAVVALERREAEAAAGSGGCSRSPRNPGGDGQGGGGGEGIGANPSPTEGAEAGKD